jgi:hypothetical protein
MSSLPHSPGQDPSRAGQPQSARGTVGHPYSALNLRFALALFGLVFCAGGALLLFLAGEPAFGWALVAVTLLTVVDLVVVQRRRSARRRAEGGQHHSLFE